ncbi:MAG: hypothetical protein ACKOZL_01520 [Actinomycetes bacterium]
MRATLGATWRRGPVVAVVALMAVALSGCQMYLVANTDSGAPDGPIVVVAPADHTQLAADFTTMPVEIDVAGVDPAEVRVFFETGSQAVFEPITGLFERSGDTWTATLPRQIFLPGVTYITAEVAPSAGERITRRVAVSWEPAIEVADADRCESLGQARCLLPFPSDAYTVEDPATDTGRRLHFDVDSMPTNVGGTPIDPTEMNRNDGFSPGALIMAEVPGLDLARTDEPRIDGLGRALLPDSPVMVIDADTRERIPVFAEIDQASLGSTPLLLVRPVRNLEEGHRYVVGLRNLRRADGSLIEPDRAFRVYRDNIPTFIPEIEARRAAVFQNMTVLAEAGMVVEDMYLAWDFTVASRRSLTERSLSIRDQTFDPLGAEGTLPFTIDAVTETPDGNTLRRITGTFTVPNFLNGDGGPGNSFHYDDPSDPDALPSPNGTYEANFICNIPRASVGADGTAVQGRSLIYGHGLLGEASQVNGFAALGNRYNYTMCATDWIGMANEDLPNVAQVLGDLSRFTTMADRMQQGILNFQVLGRLLNSEEGFAVDPAFRVGSDDRAPYRPDSLVFNGNSQGGIMGGALTALSNEFERAVLGVPGMNYSTLLSRSIDYDPFSAINGVAYPDPYDQTFGQALIQMLWDRGESNGYAHHVTEDPLPGTRAHEVLLIEAFGDHQVTNIATENQARTYGVATRMPNLDPGRSWDLTPMWGIDRITSFPYSGSALVEWDFPFATGAPPIVNLPNRAGTDPHGLGGREPRLGIQVAYFFEGLVVDVCGGTCVSPVR